MQIAKKLNYLPNNLLSTLSLCHAGFFCSLDWFENFVRTVADSDCVDVRFFYIENDSSVFIPALLLRDGFLRKVKSLSNYYSPIYTIFYGEKRPESHTAEQFFIRLANVASWDVMELRPLSEEDALFIFKCAKNAGLIASRYFCFTNWYLAVDGRSYNEYYLSLPSRLRHTIKRKSNKFFAIEGAKVEIICSEHGLEQGLSAYHSVYNASWKTPEPYVDFMPGLIKLGISKGIGRLGVAYVDNKAVAAQYWIVSDNAAYIFKLAYDENYNKYSVGTVLTARLMEYVIDHDKVNVVDFLTGDDSYKKDWMSNKQDRFGVILFNPSTLFGLIAGLSEMLKQQVKVYIKHDF